MKLFLKGLMVMTLLFLLKRFSSKTVSASAVQGKFLLVRSLKKIGKSFKMKSTGKLVYSPRTHLASSERWLVMMCDDEISKYYRHLYTMQYPYLNGEKTGKLTRPVWGTHLSIVRGEYIPNIKLWG